MQNTNCPVLTSNSKTLSIRVAVEFRPPYWALRYVRDAELFTNRAGAGLL
jgi:hypothetical protein